mmetsp:Transcript_35160/g.76853  ORF Transcript_35160/g.76853 Transcript_35160/m.76853 type:complete len:281 (+) Transcript_35160:3348-4190(+)
MQRGLAVEQHHVPRVQVPLHLVAVLEHAVAALAEEAQVHALAVLLDDVAGAALPAGRVRAVLHQALQALDVVRGHHLRDGEVERDGPGHAQLVQAEGGVGGDDGARGEVHALPHEVPADAPLLALEALRDGLDGAPGARVAARVPGDGVVHVRHHVELQQLRELRDQVRRRAALLLPPQVVVGADDVAHHVRQVVLRPGTAAHLDGRAHGQRRDGQHRQDHPIWTGLLGCQSERDAVLIADALKYAMYRLRSQVLSFWYCFRHVLIFPTPVLHGILQALE